MVVATSPDFYRIPYAEDTLVQAVDEWQGAFEEKVELDFENLSFRNNVIWTLDGKNEDSAPWQYLYAAKKGMGISCCYKDYVVANMDTLNSRYIAVKESGEVEELCKAKKYKKLFAYDGMALYERY